MNEIVTNVKNDDVKHNLPTLLAHARDVFDVAKKCC